MPLPAAHHRRRELVRAGARARTAGSLPAVERRVAQDAVLRVRPAAVEADRERRLRAVGGDERGLVVVVRARSRRWPRSASRASRRQPPGRARVRCRRASRVRRRRSPAVPPASASTAPSRSRQRRRRLHVPAGLDALGDQGVGAIGARLPRAGRRADLHHCARAGRVAAGDALGARLSPRERHDGHAEREQRLELGVDRRTRGRGWPRRAAPCARARARPAARSARAPSTCTRATRARRPRRPPRRAPAWRTSRSAPGRARARSPAGRARRVALRPPRRYISALAPWMRRPEPIVLERGGVRLEPLAEHHRDGLAAAIAADPAAFPLAGPVSGDTTLEAGSRRRSPRPPRERACRSRCSATASSPARPATSTSPPPTAASRSDRPGTARRGAAPT